MDREHDGQVLRLSEERAGGAMSRKPALLVVDVEPEPEPEFEDGPTEMPLRKADGSVFTPISPGTQEAIGDRAGFEQVLPSPAVLSQGEVYGSLALSEPVQYRALKDTQVYEQPDPGMPLQCKLSRGDVFKVNRDVIKNVPGVGELRFVEAEHSKIYNKDGGSTGWVQMTTAKGEPLCVTEASVQHLLKSVPLLQELEDDDRKKIAQVLEAGSYVEEQTIIDAGATGDGCKYMYFIEHGIATASIGQDIVRSYEKHDFFGELALLTDEPRKATVKAGKGGCRCLKLARQSFNTFASQCATILDQRRKQYAAVHVMDVSAAALESYRNRQDLRDRLPDSRMYAPPPSTSVLRLLCKVVANVPARVITMDAGHQHIDRRISEDGQTLDLLENDVEMLAKVLTEAMNRVGTTYLAPSARTELLQQQEMERDSRTSSSSNTVSRMQSQATATIGGGASDGKKVVHWGATETSDGSMTPSAPATPEKNPPTPGNRTVLGTPSGNIASMAAAAIPAVDTRAELDATGRAQYALNRAQRHHIRNFIAIARDVQAMMEKYGFDDDDMLAPFCDPTIVFGRRVGGGGIPFVASKHFEQSDIDRLLVVVKNRLRPTGDRSREEETELADLGRSIDQDQQTLEGLQSSPIRGERAKSSDALRRLEKQLLANRKRKQLLEDLQPFGSAVGYQHPLTTMEGHTLAALCDIPACMDMLTDKRYDDRRAARLVPTLLEGLLLDSQQPRKVHCDQTGRMQEFEGKQAAIQEDFAYCFMQVSKAARGRQMLLEDDRVVEYLCDIAVEGLTENATQYAKDALATLKPTTMAEKRVWCISFDEVARTGKWPIVQTPRSNLRTGTEQPQRQNPHHEWAGSGQKYAAIIAAETKAEIDAAGGIPEGDPSTADAASPAQASPAKSDVSAAPAVPRPVVKPGRVTADLLEEAARKTKVRKGLWGKVSGGGPDGGGVTAVRKNLLLNVQSKLTEKELAREGSDLCDFFEGAVEPFARRFLATDNFAMRVTNQWATVEYKDVFQMKVCSKVLVKVYDPKSQLFLVRL